MSFSRLSAPDEGLFPRPGTGVRELASTHSELAKRLDELEQKTESLAMSHDTFSRNTRNQLKQVFDALRELFTLAALPLANRLLASARSLLPSWNAPK